MIPTQEMIQSLRKRLVGTEGGIRAAAALGGIAERSATKIMAGQKVRQPTYDAFCSGLLRLETAELVQQSQNAGKAAGLIKA